MTRSDDQIDDLEFDLEKGAQTVTRIMSTPEESLEFDPTSVAPPAAEPLVEARPPSQLDHAAARPIGEIDLSSPAVIDLSSPAVPEEFSVERITPPVSRPSNSPALESPALSEPPAPESPALSESPALESPALSKPPALESLTLSEPPIRQSDPDQFRQSSPDQFSNDGPGPTIPELDVAPGGSYPPPSRPAANKNERPAASGVPVPGRAPGSGRRISSAGRPPPAPSSNPSPPRGTSSFPPSRAQGQLASSTRFGDSLDWSGLDELELGGAHAAQFDVAVPVAEREDEIGWPKGRSPFDDELQVESERIEQVSEFGTSPSMFVLFPFYTLRVWGGLKRLREKEKAAKKALLDAERARDELLAQLADRNRRQLTENDRFRPLYDAAEEIKARVTASEQLLKNTDQQGAFELNNLQSRMERSSEEERLKQRAFDEYRQAFSQAERDVQRSEAMLKRLDIEERNLEDREDRSPDSANFRAEFSQLEQQRRDLEHRLQLAEDRVENQSLLLREAKDQLKRAIAERRTCEAQKEGMLVALEGQLYEHSRHYDEAVHAHRKAMAAIGQAIVELRGEIPVDALTRQRLIAADEAVTHTALQHKTTVLAGNSMDTDAYRNGKLLLFGAAVVLLLGLLYLAMRL